METVIVDKKVLENAIASLSRIETAMVEYKKDYAVLMEANVSLNKINADLLEALKEMLTANPWRADMTLQQSSAYNKAEAVIKKSEFR